MNRRWITREEIAEIHDSIARKVAVEVAEDSSVGPNNSDSKWRHYLDHRVTARNIRATERLGNQLGERAS